MTDPGWWSRAGPPWPWLELEVALDRIAGVVYPCLVCGGRGSAATGASCGRCGDTGEEPAGIARDMAYKGNGGYF